MNLKFWKRKPIISFPYSGFAIKQLISLTKSAEQEAELEALRGKVAEYATKIVWLEKRQTATMEAWRLQQLIMHHIRCPKCGCDVNVWREVFNEKHECEVKRD